jgi:hypothetical protein
MTEAASMDLSQFVDQVPCYLQRNEPDCLINRNEYRALPLTPKEKATDDINSVCGKCPVLAACLPAVCRLQRIDKIKGSEIFHAIYHSSIVG